MKVRSITQLACADLTRNTDKTLMTSSKTRTMTNMYCNSTISIRRFCQIKYTVNSSVYYMTDVPVLSRIHAKFPKVPLLSVCVCVCVCVAGDLMVCTVPSTGLTSTPQWDDHAVSGQLQLEQQRFTPSHRLTADCPPTSKSNHTTSAWL